MPSPSASATPTRHTADAAQTREDLAVLRPDLVGRYDTELPGARATILARLLGALDREQLPGVDAPAHGRGQVRLDDGTALRFPPAAAVAFAHAGPGLAIEAWSGRDSYAATYGWLDDEGPERATWETPARPPAWTGADPGTLVRMLWPGSSLATEIDNSVANLALARADRRIRGLPGTGDPDALATLEQFVTDGHPLHPCARTRGGMSVADVLAYAPEHFPAFRLRKLRVPEDRWYGTAPPVLYAHPWQADRILRMHPWITDDGETSPVRPLMSLRTVAPVGGGPHIKTAVDIQMTSAIRTVSPAAVHNGPRLSALLHQVCAGLPIDVLAETAAGAVLVDGVPQRNLAYLRREAPTLQPGELAVPMAVLSASPLLMKTLVGADEFMARLGAVFFGPVCEILARGIALEAHGQNTLVVLREGRPVRMLYRDLGGVRVSAARLRAAGVEPPELRGDLPTDDPGVLRTKLAAAAFGTVAGELIAAFARERGDDPAVLWRAVAASLPDTTDTRHLRKEQLPIKATTAMRLAADPLDDLWAYVDNPMAAS